MSASTPVMLNGFPQVSQKRIAEEAGVSQATVSLVLAGRGVSSEETTRRVMQAAERLKYRPNLLVHGIQTGKTRTIGVMAPPVDFYWAEVLYGIHDVLSEADHVPINVWTAHTGSGPRRRNAGDGGVNELQQIHRLLDRRVDGVILWPPFASLFQGHVNEFSSRGLPVVTIDYELPREFRADSVGSDEASGGRMVAEHLLSLGHRRLGHLAGPKGEAWAEGRRAAFERTVEDAAGRCVTIQADLKASDQGMDQARELLALKDRPTAIFAATDPLAKSLYHAAAEVGLRVPQDLSVVGFADDDFAAEMAPALTTVRQSGYDTGRRAAELVLARSNGGSTPGRVQRARLPVELIVRQSTTPPPGA